MSLERFKELVSEYSNEWNSDRHKNLTLEFSTSEEDLVEKFKILQEASEGLDTGQWYMGECDTCRGHDKNSPYHVDIRKCYTERDVYELQRELFFTRKALKEATVHGNVSVDVNTLVSCVNALEGLTETPEGIDAYLELTSLVDEYKGGLNESH